METKENLKYSQILYSLENKLEKYLLDIINDNPDRSVKAEQYVQALCLGRHYILEKVCNTTNKENIGDIQNES